MAFRRYTRYDMGLSQRVCDIYFGYDSSLAARAVQTPLSTVVFGDAFVGCRRGSGAYGVCALPVRLCRPAKVYILPILTNHLETVFFLMFFRRKALKSIMKTVA